MNLAPNKNELAFLLAEHKANVKEKERREKERKQPSPESKVARKEWKRLLKQIHAPLKPFAKEKLIEVRKYDTLLVVGSGSHDLAAVHLLDSSDIVPHEDLIGLRGSTIHGVATMRVEQYGINLLFTDTWRGYILDTRKDGPRIAYWKDNINKGLRRINEGETREIHDVAGYFTYLIHLGLRGR